MTDIVSFKIKNITLLISLAGLMIFRLLHYDLQGILSSIIAAFLIFAVLYPFFVIGIIRAGDIKLIMITAMYLSFTDFISVAVSTVISSVILIVICIKGYGSSKSSIRFPFAFALMLGAYPYWKI
ncbi:MAG: hypothetical protein K6G03_03465 [Lachnospiraceae bacterium]|nr:hypothetical protein [Lachnospiraceae bacterium]